MRRLGCGRPGSRIALLTLILAGVAAGAVFDLLRRPPLAERGVGPPASRASFPGAAAAFASADFRITGVHFWQGNWNYTFWSNLKIAHVAPELRRIRALGLNTVVLTIPWGEFQTDAASRRYRDDRFAALEEVLRAAEAERLYVILRVGTLERVPSDVAGGGNYSAPHLFFDDAQLAAYADLARETAARTARHRNLLFMFWTWEDLMGFMNVAHDSEPVRAAYLARVPAFREHLRTQPIAHWNRAWGTSYASHEQVPFPAYRTPAFAELWRFADERLVQSVLPRLAAAAHAGDPDVRLSYEVRIDVEPVQDGDRAAWVDHERTWNLPSGYDLATAYFNPYWGARNEGDVITPETAFRHFREFLDRFEARTGRAPLFFDQFNFVDSTPAFRHNSRLGNEPAIFRFLSAAIPEMYRRSRGYALWSLDRYEANVVYDPSFESGLEAWTVGSASAPDACGSIRDDPERAERYLHLAPGCSARQIVRAAWNPGGASPEVPYHARLLVRGAPATAATFTWEPMPGTGATNGVTRTIPLAPEWRTVDLELPFAWAFQLAVTAAPDASVDVDEMTVFNHVQDAALFDTRGQILGRRAEAVGTESARWRRRHPDAP